VGTVSAKNAEELAVFEDRADRTVADGAALAGTGAAADFSDRFRSAGFDGGSNFQIGHFQTATNDLGLHPVDCGCGIRKHLASGITTHCEKPLLGTLISQFPESETT